jgi:hypothetical protein
MFHEKVPCMVNILLLYLLTMAGTGMLTNSPNTKYIILNTTPLSSFSPVLCTVLY